MEAYDDPGDYLSRTITSSLYKYLPLWKMYYKHCKYHTPWLSPEILSAICEKQKAKHIAEKSGSDSDIYNLIQT